MHKIWIKDLITNKLEGYQELIFFIRLKFLLNYYSLISTQM